MNGVITMIRIYQDSDDMSFQPYPHEYEYD